MSAKLIPAFRKTLDKSNEWLDEIMDQLDWSDRRQAYKALRAVLHTLRNRLTNEEVTDLAAQLPMLIRGMYFEGWNPNARRKRMKSATDFVESVNHNFAESEFVASDDITRAVLQVIEKHVSQGEVEDIIFSLPLELQDLWTET
jgi:uncharacterized protein (DUF2267 family)